MQIKLRKRNVAKLETKILIIIRMISATLAAKQFVNLNLNGTISIFASITFHEFIFFTSFVSGMENDRNKNLPIKKIN